MSQYKNVVSDFPRRCLDVLRLTEKSGKFERRDVTVTLMAACAGLVIPFERLDPRKFHPAADSRRHPEAARKLKELLAKEFLQSLGEGGNWRTGTLTTIEGDPDGWNLDQNAKPMGHQKTSGGVLRVIRNALAHGNVFTFGDPIEKIIVASANKFNQNNEHSPITIETFEFFETSPADFRSFLVAWLGFLAAERIPQAVINRELADAA